MKNIHEIGKHIYITSDEETLSNNGDYYLGDPNYDTIHKWNMIGMHKDKQVLINKIILTTDQDLIKDGVQPIDNEFLEWFVKNPTCEYVEVEELYPLTCCIQKEGKTKMNNGCMQRNRCLNYKIIIPKEEPKQETLEEAVERYVWGGIYLNEAEKQQTEIAFIEGAKWQQERMYSEEDMRKAFIAGGNSQIEEDDDYGTEYDAYMEEWFEQFKKEDKQ